MDNIEIIIAVIGLIAIFIAIYVREALKFCQAQKYAAVQANAVLHRLCKEILDFKNTRIGTACFGDDSPQTEEVSSRLALNCMNHIFSSSELKQLDGIIASILPPNPMDNFDPSNRLFTSCKQLCVDATAGLSPAYTREINTIEKKLEAYINCSYYPFEKETSYISQDVARISGTLRNTMMSFLQAQASIIHSLNEFDGSYLAKKKTYCYCVMSLLYAGIMCREILAIWRVVESTQNASKTKLFLHGIFA